VLVNEGSDGCLLFFPEKHMRKVFSGGKRGRVSKNGRFSRPFLVANKVRKLRAKLKAEGYK